MADDDKLTARATEFLGKLSDEDKRGIQDLHNLSLSMGLPAARATFTMMVEAAGLHGKKKTKISNAILNISPVTEVGCYKVDFFNKDTGKADVAYMLLDVCHRDHDLGAELDCLKKHATEEKWAEILKHLSMLVALARKTYSETARSHISLIRGIFGLSAFDPCTAYLDYKVDPGNTTLYIDPTWPTRIGIWIKKDS